MYTNARYRATEITPDFGTKFGQNYMNDKTFEKNKHQNRNKHIIMYPFTKSISIWRTSDFATKIGQKNMLTKILRI